MDEQSTCVLSNVMTYATDVPIGKIISFTNSVYLFFHIEVTVKPKFLTQYYVIIGVMISQTKPMSKNTQPSLSTHHHVTEKSPAQ